MTHTYIHAADWLVGRIDGWIAGRMELDVTCVLHELRILRMYIFLDNLSAGCWQPAAVQVRFFSCWKLRNTRYSNCLSRFNQTKATV